MRHSGPVELRFMVPGRVPGLNDLNRMKGSNKFAYNAQKRSWDGLVALAARSAVGPENTTRLLGRGQALVLIHVVEPNRKRDPDNVAGAARKFVHDGLVLAGVLENDGWRHVVPDLRTTLEVGDDPRIEVTVRWGWEDACEG